jgi:hypothetical protein
MEIADLAEFQIRSFGINKIAAGFFIREKGPRGTAVQLHGSVISGINRENQWFARKSLSISFISALSCLPGQASFEGGVGSR